MSEAKHTPGPWASRLPVGPSVGVAGVAWSICGPVDHDGFLVVAEVLGTGPACEATPETNANGHLIAAAPELLAACVRAADVIDRWPHAKQALHPHIEVLTQLRDVIAKAKGA